jgi:hypothetical protein
MGEMTFLLFVLFLFALCLFGRWFERRWHRQQNQDFATMEEQQKRATELHQTAQIYREMGDQKTANEYAEEVYRILTESPASFRRRKHEAGAKAGAGQDPPTKVEADRS